VQPFDAGPAGDFGGPPDQPPPDPTPLEVATIPDYSTL
jgi:hypothetical protein